MRWGRGHSGQGRFEQRPTTEPRLNGAVTTPYDFRLAKLINLTRFLGVFIICLESYERKNVTFPGR